MDATGYHNQSGLSHQKSPNKCEFYLSQSEKWIRVKCLYEHNCVLEVLQISEKLNETMSVVSWMAGQRVPSSGFFLLNFQKFDVKTEMKGNADGMLNAEVPSPRVSQTFWGHFLCSIWVATCIDKQ